MIAIISAHPANEQITVPHFKCALIDGGRYVARNVVGYTPARALALATGHSYMNAPWSRSWPVPSDAVPTVSFEVRS